MTARIVLLASALLGEEAWSDVWDVLSRRGYRVSVAGSGSGRSPEEVAAAYLSAVPAAEPVVLVPHSNAGLYVPGLVAERDVEACVFVDASLPPASGSVVMAGGERLTRLSSMTGPDGLLPPWTAWWDEDDAAALFPSPQVRERVEAGQVALPLTYFTTPVPIPSGWERVPCAYLSFGGGQVSEIAAATARGWPVLDLPGHHLHLLTRPEEVATAVLDLRSRLLPA